jgi:TolA-binding protein
MGTARPNGSPSLGGVPVPSTRLDSTRPLDRSKMSWRRANRNIIAQLEQQRSRLEQVRERARRQGGPEVERLEAQATTRLREIEQRINDLQASLE